MSLTYKVREFKNEGGRPCYHTHDPTTRFGEDAITQHVVADKYVSEEKWD